MIFNTPAQIRHDDGSIRLSWALSTLLSIISIPLIHVSPGISTVFASVGGIYLIAGSTWNNERFVHRGFVFLLFGIFVGVLGGGGIIHSVLAMACVIIAWDMARWGILLSTQIGVERNVSRNEFVHFAHTITVVLIGVIVLISVTLIPVTTGLITPLALLLFGVFLVLMVLS